MVGEAGSGSQTNDINDEQKARLLTKGIEKLEKLIADKDWAVAAIRTQRKAMKSDGFLRPEVDFALELRKQGDELARESIAMRVRIAAWLGRPLGYQPTLDLSPGPEAVH